MEGETWEEWKHIALELRSPFGVKSGLPSNGDTDELRVVALVPKNEHGLR